MSGRCCCPVGNGKLGTRKSLRVMTRRKTFFPPRERNYWLLFRVEEKAVLLANSKSPPSLRLLPLLPLCSLIQWHGRRGGNGRGPEPRAAWIWGNSGCGDLSLPSHIHTRERRHPPSLHPPPLCSPRHLHTCMHTTQRGRGSDMPPCMLCRHPPLS